MIAPPKTFAAAAVNPSSTLVRMGDMRGKNIRKSAVGLGHRIRMLPNAAEEALQESGVGNLSACSALKLCWGPPARLDRHSYSLVHSSQISGAAITDSDILVCDS
jgi:hypothetical protein